jgi:putative transposase
MFRRTNQLLRTLVNTRHDDWEQFVPLVEFHLNSTPRRGLDKTPFEIDLGYQPTLSFATELLQHEGARHAAADKLMELFSEMDTVIRSAIQEIREDQNSRNSAGRRTPKFVAGDMVYLKTNHLKAFQNKLAPRWLGLLKILAALKYDTYKLEIPERFKKMHPVVHVSKLQPAHVPENSPRKPADIDPLFDKPDDTVKDRALILSRVQMTRCCVQHRPLLLRILLEWSEKGSLGLA